MALRVGDVVQLRHGNGALRGSRRLKYKGADEWATCVWGVQDERHNYFAAEMLRTVEIANQNPENRKPEAGTTLAPQLAVSISATASIRCRCTEAFGFGCQISDF
jgi:hypothetical protein